MLIAYWILGGLVAAVYLYSGAIKTVRSRSALRPMMKWIDRFPMPAVRVIGVLELLGAIGLVVPPLTGIAPWLAFAAALGLLLVQVGAIATHLTTPEDRNVVINLVLLVATAALLWLATVWV